MPKPVIKVLSRDLAEKHITSLTELANLIPGIKYSPEDILAEQKGDRQMLGKWRHSLIVFVADKPEAFIMGYERAGEGNAQYPENTIYLSELAVAEKYQDKGIGRGLIRSFFERNNKLGFQFLDGELNYSIQTNSANSNRHIVDLYKSFGFEQRAIKNYPNRTDVVLGVKASEILI